MVCSDLYLRKNKTLTWKSKGLFSPFSNLLPQKNPMQMNCRNKNNPQNDPRCGPCNHWGQWRPTSWFPNNHTNTHSHAQEVTASGDNWRLKWLGMTDWRLSQLYAFLPAALSSLSSPAASPAASLWQEAGSGQACQRPAPGSAALCLMTPNALRWRLRNKHALLAVFFCFLIHSCSAPCCHFHGASSPWTSLFCSSSISGIAPAGSWRDVVRPSHTSPSHSTLGRRREAAPTNWPALCSSAPDSDTTVPLWQMLLFTKLGHPRSEWLKC